MFGMPALHRPVAALLAACGLLLSAGAAQAQLIGLPRGLSAHASGVFLNADGDVLTARHAVRDCGTLYAVKDATVVLATVLVEDESLDLAVLGTTLKPYLSATFQKTPNASASVPVFAEGYNVLQRMPDRASTVFNGMTVPGQSEISLLSPAQPGASGGPVLGGAGLLMGVIVERVALDGNPSNRVALSRARAAGTSSASRVKAVSGESIKSFLRTHAVPFAESDVPQLGPLQAQAPRATTLSVGVICG
ncbi:hypothetical protein BRI6_3260 [plant metagenome]|uniref:Trypsin-like peptidase domain-containing protein n=1 Tax=plant metagenome TaxID=1297885 RepID=A0A484NU26_9ZZZZ